jgi:hypothetical protein
VTTSLGQRRLSLALERRCGVLSLTRCERDVEPATHAGASAKIEGMPSSTGAGVDRTGRARVLVELPSAYCCVAVTARRARGGRSMVLRCANLPRCCAKPRSNPPRGIIV